MKRLIRAVATFGCLCGLVAIVPESRAQEPPPEVLDDEPVPSVIGSLGKQRTRLFQNLQFEVRTTDAPNPGSRVEASGLPSGATLTNLGDGIAVFSWTPVTGQEGEYRVEFSDGVEKSGGGSEVVIIMAAAYPLSHGFYRVPYGENLEARVSRDHITHTPPIKEDWISVGAGALANMPIVAAADGRIRSITDGNTRCCNADGCSSCNNSIWIEHSNGEWTKYSHPTTGSVTALGWAVNDCVQAGDTLGFEGDVGHTSGSGSINQFQTQCPGADPVDTTKRCGIHLHWEVRATSQNSDLRVPLLCGVFGSIAYAGDTVMGLECDPGACVPDVAVANVFIADNQIHVTKASNSITSEAIYGMTTSAAYFAGNRITLRPGFQAFSGTYFHAMIKDCEGGPTGCPPQ